MKKNFCISSVKHPVQIRMNMNRSLTIPAAVVCALLFTLSCASSRAAILAFNGDVYDGMRAPSTFTDDDFDHAQNVLRMLSGLYGVLRPLDLMLPYRLEMGTRLPNPNGRDLYSYWGDDITTMLIRRQ